MRSTFKLHNRVNGNGTGTRTFRDNILKDVKEHTLSNVFKSFTKYIYQKSVTFTGNIVLSYLASKHYVLPWIEANKKHLEDRAAEVLMGQSSFRFKSAGEAGFEKTDD